MTDNQEPRSSNNKSIVVYTALFGKYDDLMNPECYSINVKYVCFTDQKDLTSDHWEIILVDLNGMNPAEANRYYKMMPHLFFKSFEISIYIDANVKVLCSLDTLTEIVSARRIAIPPHFSRSSIVNEAYVVLRSGRANVLPTIKFLLNTNLRDCIYNADMGENNVILRRHNLLIDLQTEWWGLYKSGINRDQLTLAPLLCKYGISNYLASELSSRGGVFFERVEHKENVKKSYFLILLRLVGIVLPLRLFMGVLRWWR